MFVSVGFRSVRFDLLTQCIRDGPILVNRLFSAVKRPSLNIFFFHSKPVCVFTSKVDFLYTAWSWSLIFQPVRYYPGRILGVTMTFPLSRNCHNRSHLTFFSGHQSASLSHLPSQMGPLWSVWRVTFVSQMRSPRLPEGGGPVHTAALGWGASAFP